MNYENLTKKELILLAKRAEEIIKDALDIANNNESYPSRMGEIKGTLRYYVTDKLMEEERERE